MKTASSAPNFNYGYPTPGPQNPTGPQVMDHVFFLSQEEWKRVREEERFNFIIIGSGFCALGFADRVLQNDPHARILIIERGPFFLPEHFQNLPLPFQQTLGGLSETFPWTLSASTINQQYIKWQHGMVPFFGGRSTLWSAWCPRPTRDEMRHWPEEVINTAQEYFEQAEYLLNVIPANEIDKDCTALPVGYRPIFGVLQEQLTKRLEKNLNKIGSATRVIPAPLAVGSSTVQGIDFNKFSTPAPLLSLLMKQRQLEQQEKGGSLKIATDCIVSRVVQQEGKATALETSRGIVNVGDAKVILAMGTLPPTTLILNYFPQVTNAGSRFTAHFISSIVARIPRNDYEFNSELEELELAAIYLAGENEHTQGQYHIQITALSDRDPLANAATAARHMPDVVATASMQQLLSSKDYVVFVCAVLGELDYNNPRNRVRKTEGNDLTSNVLLQVEENEKDLAVWDTMEEGTFEALERVLSPQGPGRVEYWHGDANGSGTWQAIRPDPSEIRVPGMVHEGSTLYIGSDEDAVVGLDYRPKGVENVYVTGASLWPVSGSWNPTLTMVGLAQHLADTLSRQSKSEIPPLKEWSLESTKTSSVMS
ncbi:hypothetical protein A7311_20630 [Paenibacillus polymyxa]|uniref:GMC oxidoreductase n=1 Tax=Paenibacillus polymyxa TaxID=1406 RepID=UPI00083E0CCF|nr:GMC oxidoreductase [Paenibacillus polymyxa]ODB55044.1 hypothetical protein A7311_20630 [Paenibacillus polymyxa]